MHAEVKKRCVTKGIKTLLPNKWNHGNGTKKKIIIISYQKANMGRPL